MEILDNLMKWIKLFFVEPRKTLTPLSEFYNPSASLGYSGMFLNIPISSETPPVHGALLSPPLECPADLLGSLTAATASRPRRRRRRQR